MLLQGEARPRLGLRKTSSCSLQSSQSLSSLTFVCERSEEVSLNRLEGLSYDFLVDDSVWRIILIKQVDEFDQALFLRLLKLLIFLRVREVCHFDASAQLRDVEELPLRTFGVCSVLVAEMAYLCHETAGFS